MVVSDASGFQGLSKRKSSDLLLLRILSWPLILLNHSADHLRVSVKALSMSTGVRVEHLTQKNFAGCTLLCTQAGVQRGFSNRELCMVGTMAIMGFPSPFLGTRICMID